MDTIDDLSVCMNYFLKPIFTNKVSKSIITLLIVLYAGLAAPKLPEPVLNLFRDKLFKMMILFLIAYTVTTEPSIAIVSAMAFILSIQTLSSYDKKKPVKKQRKIKKIKKKIKKGYPKVNDEQPIKQIKKEILNNSKDNGVPLDEDNKKIKKIAEKAQKTAKESSEILLSWDVNPYSNDNGTEFYFN